MHTCWHTVITLPMHEEKLSLQTTVKTQKALLFGRDCQHHLASMPMVQAYFLLLYRIQLCLSLRHNSKKPQLQHFLSPS